MKRARTISLLFFLSLFLPAQVIKIGSVAPDRSPWDDALKQIARYRLAEVQFVRHH